MNKKTKSTKSNAELIRRFASSYSRETITNLDKREAKYITEELTRREVITEEEAENLYRFFLGY